MAYINVSSVCGQIKLLPGVTPYMMSRLCMYHANQLTTYSYMYVNDCHNVKYFHWSLEIVHVSAIDLFSTPKIMFSQQCYGEC